MKSVKFHADHTGCCCRHPKNSVVLIFGDATAYRNTTQQRDVDYLTKQLISYCVSRTFLEAFDDQKDHFSKLFKKFKLELKKHELKSSISLEMFLKKIKGDLEPFSPKIGVMGKPDYSSYSKDFLAYLKKKRLIETN